MAEIFPISFVMNRVFQTYEYLNTVPCNPEGGFVENEQCIGLSPYFNKHTIAFKPRSLIREVRNLDKRGESAKEEFFKSSVKHAIPGKFKQALADIEKKRQMLLEQHREEYPHLEGGTFKSNQGQIAIPLPFETLVNLIALAQSGKIVRLSYEQGSVIPEVSVTGPNLSNVVKRAKAPKFNLSGAR